LDGPVVYCACVGRLQKQNQLHTYSFRYPVKPKACTKNAHSCRGDVAVVLAVFVVPAALADVGTICSSVCNIVAWEWRTPLLQRSRFGSDLLGLGGDHDAGCKSLECCDSFCNTSAAVCPLIERSTSDNRWLIPVYKDADISIDSSILLSGKKGRLPWFPHSKLCKYNCSRNSLNT